MNGLDQRSYTEDQIRRAMKAYQHLADPRQLNAMARAQHTKAASLPWNVSLERSVSATAIALDRLAAEHAE